MANSLILVIRDDTNNSTPVFNTMVLNQGQYGSGFADAFASQGFVNLLDGVYAIDDITKGYIETDLSNLDSDVENIIRSIGMRQCDVCHNWVNPQDIRSGESVWDLRTHKRRCATCQRIWLATQQTSRELSLSGYHETNCCVKFINDDLKVRNLTRDDVGVGIEMEVNGNCVAIENDKFIATPDFYEIANDDNPDNQVFRLEHDCTVAMEIISNVFSKEALKRFDFSILTNQTKKLGNDPTYSQVGFHVHLTKTLLGDTDAEQALNFLKLQYFLFAYSEDFKKLSGRDINSTDDWEYCEFYNESDLEEVKATVKSNIANGYRAMWSHNHWGRGSALIAGAEGKTIEFRFGHSTNDPVKISNYLQLLYGIVENVKNVPTSKVFCLSRMFKLVPKDVLAYWRSQGFFLKTVATDDKGFTF